MGKLRKAIDSLRIWAKRHWIGLAISAVIIAWAITPLIAPLVVAIAERIFGPKTFEGAGQFGDQFGAANALFTAMTVLLVFIAFWAERKDRKEADNRWRQERTDRENDQVQAEVDRRVRHFFDSLERYVRAREAVRYHWPAVEALRNGQEMTSGANAIGQHRAGLEKAFKTSPSDYLSQDHGEARAEFAKRASNWFKSQQGQMFKPMLAHVASMNWARQYVGHPIGEQSAATKASTHAMLLSAARGVITSDEFALLASYGLIDSQTREFVLEVYDLDANEPPFATHLFDWLYEGVVQLPGDEKESSSGRATSEPNLPPAG